MKSPDNKRIIVPNSQITGSAIINYSAEKTRRVDLIVGISYDSDLKKAKQLLEQILKADSRILAEPARNYSCWRFSRQFSQYFNHVHG